MTGIHVGMAIHAKALKIAFVIVQFVFVFMMHVDILAVVAVCNLQTAMLASIVVLLAVGSADVLPVACISENIHILLLGLVIRTLQDLNKVC